MTPTRRSLLLGASALGLSGCKVLDRLAAPASRLGAVFASANSLTYRVHRALGGGHSLAPEFRPEDIRQGMHPNGSTDPQAWAYLAAQTDGWAACRLEVGGLVAAPLSLSLAQITALPA